jgi:hypothetical protein
LEGSWTTLGELLSYSTYLGTWHREEQGLQNGTPSLFSGGPQQTVLVDCVPLNLHVEVLTLSISACDLIWKQSLSLSDQGEMRSLGWVLTQDDWCLYNKG